MVLMYILSKIFYLRKLLFFHVFGYDVMYANEFETKEKQKLPELKKIAATYIKQWIPNSFNSGHINVPVPFLQEAI